MKSVFFALVILGSSLSYACEVGCDSLMANYTCEIPVYFTEMEKVDASVTKKSAQEVEVKIGSEGGTYIIDGNSHKSTHDDTTYVAKCADHAIVITQSFKGQTASVEIRKSEKGMTYSIPSKGMTIDCTKK